ncbi:MAG: ligase-associated DNA damage response exonuclease [Ignavibacteria bacterium]|nr:ligase-associated DNA damage response exonuclease [Ignavibacteria bacterium]
MARSLLVTTPMGLYSPQGDFYVDPHGYVDKAIISHGHSDHARKVVRNFLAHKDSRQILRTRLGSDISLETLEYGEEIKINGVTVSLHPAGHLLGSSQIRLEYKGNVTVFTGDFGTTENPTCAPFEPVKCDTFITESTFALPIYDWDDPKNISSQINEWWVRNKRDRITSLLLGYSLGKAQRLLASLNPEIGKIYVSSPVEEMNRCYREAGINLPDTLPVEKLIGNRIEPGGIMVAPQANGSEEWLAATGEYTTAFASGWMMVRGRRRMGNIGRGFVLSDHADWKGLLRAVEATDAEKILATHGFSQQFTRYLREKGYDAEPLETAFAGDTGYVREVME